jgi:phosphoglycolate phosphatase-like HAD superfamily hydrolase
MSNNILLLWDIDGTLLHCGGSGRKSLEETFKTIFDVHNALDGISLAGQLDKGIIQSALNKHDINDENFHKIYETYKDILKRELEINDQFMVIPGIKEILEFTTKHENIYNVIATGNSKVGAILKLKRANLDYYFDFGAYGDAHESREELIKNALIIAEKEYNIRYNKECVFVIGDTPNDIIAGKKNDLKTVAFSTGSYALDDLRQYEPDYIFDQFSIDQFIKLINNA